jgi:hypothetical protein
MPIEPTPAQQALLDVARAEHKYLRESQAHDGFELTELETSDVTDEEYQAFFRVSVDGKTLHFLYSLGFDVDDGGYTPYCEVNGGGDGRPDAFATKLTGGERNVRSQAELLESIASLEANVGDARYKAFQWVENVAPRSADTGR